MAVTSSAAAMSRRGNMVGSRAASIAWREPDADGGQRHRELRSRHMCALTVTRLYGSALLNFAVYSPRRQPSTSPPSTWTWTSESNLAIASAGT
jgi:hypothetical protein